MIISPYYITDDITVNNIKNVFQGDGEGLKKKNKFSKFIIN